MKNIRDGRHSGEVMLLDWCFVEEIVLIASEEQ